MTFHNSILLLAAITAEVIGTTSLKLSEGFTNLIPSVVVVAGYGASFYFLSLGLKQGLPLGLAYAIWAGLGTAVVAIIGVALFQDKLNPGMVAGIALIIVGVVLLNFFSSTR